MKLSLNWLKEYVALPDDLTMDQLAYDLTMRTVEVEDTVDLDAQFDHIVCGKLLSVRPHPNADRLSVCQVDVGLAEPRQIVCGGSNLVEGHYVVVNLPGSKAVWHGEGEPVVIEETELRGLSSYGMISGSYEVGLQALFPAPEMHHIVDLTEEGLEGEVDLHPGLSLADVLGLHDQILEIENKSITNRPDLWGHYGVARELSAIYHVPLKPLPEDVVPREEAYPVSIADADLCHRFLAAHYTGVCSKKSPLWLRSRLFRLDIRPISAPVDITNYVMLATGQPTHAYDADHLKGGLVARRAQDGETLELLDGKELVLSSENLVIADGEKALGLAGLMGGKHDSILPETREIVLEIANFDAANVRKTAQRFGVRTEASSRNEKGLDVDRVDPSFAVADQLIHELFPEAKRVAFSDVGEKHTTPVRIEVALAWLERRLGRDLSYARLEALLAPLGFFIEAEGAAEAEGERPLSILVPSWRATGDVSLPDDILEEVARMIGYENFSLKAPTVTLTHALNQRGETLTRRLMEYLAFSCGFQEITSYPWVRDESLALLEEDPATLLSLDMPPAPDQSVLRPSHLPNLMDAIVKNVRYFEAFSIFEVGQVYHRGASSPSSPDEVLPEMHRELAGAMVGQDAEALFYRLKGVLEGLGEAVQTTPLGFSREQRPAWADRDGWLSIVLEGEVIGAMGLLSTRAKNALGLKFHDAALFAFNLDRLKPFDSRTNLFHHLPQYPHVFQDLSLLVDEETHFAALKDAVGSRAESVAFIDEYRGKQIPEGKKSVTLRVELASTEGTLTADEIDRRMETIKAALAEAGATVRNA